MIDDTRLWPPPAFPSLAGRVPIAGGALPPLPTGRPDVVTNLTRTVAARRVLRPTQRGHSADPRPRRRLTPEEDRRLLDILRLPTPAAREAAYAELADEWGVALRTVLIRAWWLAAHPEDAGG